MDGPSNYNHNPLYKGNENIPLNKGNHTENKYPTKIGKYDAVLGRNVRLKTGKDGQDQVKLDSNLGKAAREILEKVGLKKPGDVRYVKDLSQKMQILNSLQTKENSIEFKSSNDSKIASILAKEIVKDKKFYENGFRDAQDPLSDRAIHSIKGAQSDLYEKMQKYPMINALMSDYYSGLHENEWVTDGALAHLESQGVDLKKGKLDGEKFVNLLVEKKYNELPDFHKDPTNLPLTKEIKSALKEEISQRYQNTQLLEALAQSKSDMNDVNKLCRKILKDDYKSIITDIEKRHQAIQKIQEKNFEEMAGKSRLLFEISHRALPTGEFEVPREGYSLFHEMRHYYNEVGKFGVDAEHGKFDKDKFLNKLADDKVKANPELSQKWVKWEMEKRYTEIEDLMSSVDKDNDPNIKMIDDKISHLFDDDYSKFQKEIDLTH